MKQGIITDEMHKDMELYEIQLFKNLELVKFLVDLSRLVLISIPCRSLAGGRRLP